jgi:hypothetical protein
MIQAAQAKQLASPLQKLQKAANQVRSQVKDAKVAKDKDLVATVKRSKEKYSGIYKFDFEGSDYTDKGDTRFESPSMRRQREAAKGSDKLQRAAHKFWETLDKGLADTMTKEEYCFVHSRITVALAPNLGEQDRRDATEVDWLEDLGIAEEEADSYEDRQQFYDAHKDRRMTVDQFATGLCSLADMWTDDVAELDYIVFLNKLFRRITNPVRSALYERASSSQKRTFKPLAAINPFAAALGNGHQPAYADSDDNHSDSEDPYEGDEIDEIIFDRAMERVSIAYAERNERRRRNGMRLSLRQPDSPSSRKPEWLIEAIRRDREQSLRRHTCWRRRRRSSMQRILALLDASTPTIDALFEVEEDGQWKSDVQQLYQARRLSALFLALGAPGGGTDANIALLLCTARKAPLLPSKAAMALARAVAEGALHNAIMDRGFSATKRKVTMVSPKPEILTVSTPTGVAVASEFPAGMGPAPKDEAPECQVHADAHGSPPGLVTPPPSPERRQLQQDAPNPTDEEARLEASASADADDARSPASPTSLSHVLSLKEGWVTDADASGAEQAQVFSPASKLRQPPSWHSARPSHATQPPIPATMRVRPGTGTGGGSLPRAQTPGGAWHTSDPTTSPMIGWDLSVARLQLLERAAKHCDRSFDVWSDVLLGRPAALMSARKPEHPTPLYAPFHSAALRQSPRQTFQDRQSPLAGGDGNRARSAVQGPRSRKMHARAQLPDPRRAD